MTLPISPSTSASPSFGDYAAEYEEWGQPQRDAATRLVAGALPLICPRPHSQHDVPPIAASQKSHSSHFSHPPARPLRILDAGAGPGFIRDALDHAGVLHTASLICLDTSLPMLRFGARKPGFHPVAADAAALPIAPRSIDHIYSSFTLHWLDDLGAFFREAHRVLVPGGGLHVAVPIMGSLAEFQAAIAPIARNANYELNLDVYPETEAIHLATVQSRFQISHSSTTEFTYTPETIRDMLAFMRYAGAGRIMRPRHKGDLLRFTIRLARHVRPVPLVFRMLLLHAENANTTH